MYLEGMALVESGVAYYPPESSEIHWVNIYTKFVWEGV